MAGLLWTDSDQWSNSCATELCILCVSTLGCVLWAFVPNDSSSYLWNPKPSVTRTHVVTALQLSARRAGHFVTTDKPGHFQLIALRSVARPLPTPVTVRRARRFVCSLAYIHRFVLHWFINVSGLSLPWDTILRVLKHRAIRALNYSRSVARSAKNVSSVWSFHSLVRRHKKI